MKRWWHSVTKNYFTFSKRERNGLLLLIILGLSIYLAAHYWPVTALATKPDAFQQELATLKITVDSSTHNFRSYQHNNNDEESGDYDRSNRYEHWKDKKGELFAFDPNTLDEAGWKRLGLKEWTIATIQKFVSKGFKFKQPEDLSKIYGLRPQDVERLIPYVQIAADKTATTSTTSNNNTDAPYANKSAAYKPTIININTADTSTFIALPGIGSKLANRIVTYREKLGGFVNVNQVGETFGLQDSIFQKIKLRFECNSPVVRQVNINTSDAAQLKTHPYIRWNIANSIFNYRTQHGNFKSVDDLKKIDLFTEDLFQKLKPYLTL